MPNPTGYCTVDEIISIFQAQQNIIKFGSADTDNLTKEQVEKYIYDVERRIDARIKFRYSTPLDVPVDDVINQIARYRTAYDIFVDVYPSREWEALPEAVVEWRRRADDLLKDIISGAILLEVPTVEGTGIRAMTSHLKRAREIEIQLSNTDWTITGYEFIVANSFIAVPKEEDWANKYQQGTDYEVVWKEGYVRRVTTSSIPEGKTIYLYFLYLETEEFQEGTIQRRDIIEGGYI